MSAGFIEQSSMTPEQVEREWRRTHCARCGKPGTKYDCADPARGRACVECANRCHESTDFAHICQVCAAPGERYP